MISLVISSGIFIWNSGFPPGIYIEILPRISPGNLSEVLPGITQGYVFGVSQAVSSEINREIPKGTS